MALFIKFEENDITYGYLIYITPKKRNKRRRRKKNGTKFQVIQRGDKFLSLAKKAL